MQVILHKIGERHRLLKQQIQITIFTVLNLIIYKLLFYYKFLIFSIVSSRAFSSGVGGYYSIYFQNLSFLCWLEEPKILIHTSPALARPRS